MPSNVWPDERTYRLLDLWRDDTKSLADIAAELGVTRCALTGKQNRLNLPRRPKPVPLAQAKCKITYKRRPDSWPQSRLDRLKELWPDDTKTVYDIGCELGVSRGAVCGMRRRLKLTPRAIGSKGGREYRSVRKTRVSRLGQFKELWQDGTKSREVIAKEIGISLSTVCEMRRALGLATRAKDPKPREYTQKFAAPAVEDKIEKVHVSEAPLIQQPMMPFGVVRTCQYPTGHSPHILFECVEHTVNGSSYCAEHYRRCYLRRWHHGDDAFAA